MSKILVTGSSGLIGSALVDRLRSDGIEARGVDQVAALTTDIEHRLHPGDPALADLIEDVEGIIHLAGVSRVVWGQRDPAECWNNNVRLTAALLDRATTSPSRPWFIYASSREVYGQAAQLPAADDAPAAPLNVYACSKAAAEMLVEQAVRRLGLRGAVLRFSTVYGGVNDHPDRVIPAFMTAALRKQPMIVFGSEVALDPTWLGDTVDGIVLLAKALDAGRLPERPILLSSGQAVRLVDLAKRIDALVGGANDVTVAAPRSYDVERFAGLPRYAAEFLNWSPRTSLDTGLSLYAERLGAAAPA